MVVDDDADIVEAIRTVLQEEGYSVATARNGRDALSQLSRVRPRMILLDLTMPEVDGASFRNTQLGDDALAPIPTVVMTARTAPGRAAGPLLAHACLAKPLELDELLALVEHYCDTDVEARAATSS